LQAELEPQLDAWRVDSMSKQDRGLALLLSTMHLLLWDDLGWEPVHMLFDKKELRKAYRDAIRVIHPDKVQNRYPDDVKKQYISKYIQDAITSAYR